MVQLIIIIYRIDTVYRWSKLSWESPSNLMLLLPWCWPCWKKMAMSKLNYLSLFFLLSQKAEAHCMSSSFLAEVIKCEKIWEKLALSFFLLSFPIFFLVYKDLVLLWRILKIRLVHLLHPNSTLSFCTTGFDSPSELWLFLHLSWELIWRVPWKYLPCKI